MMEAVDIQAVESKLSDVTVTAIPMTPPPPSPSIRQQQAAISNNNNNNAPKDLSTAAPTIAPAPSSNSSKDNVSKYVQLLLAIEEMGREVRPTYAGSRSSAERLKRGIVQARILVRECLLETERSARQ